MAFSFQYNPAMVSSKDLLSNVLVGVKCYGRSGGCRAKDENSACHLIEKIPEVVLFRFIAKWPFVIFDINMSTTTIFFKTTFTYLLSFVL